MISIGNANRQPVPRLPVPPVPPEPPPGVGRGPAEIKLPNWFRKEVNF